MISSLLFVAIMFAALAAVFDFIPRFLPFLAPVERPAAGHADFARKHGFLVAHLRFLRNSFAALRCADCLSGDCLSQFLAIMDKRWFLRKKS